MMKVPKFNIVKIFCGVIFSLILILPLLLNCNNISAQTKLYSAPEHINVDHNTLYIGRSNLVVIDPRGDSTHQLSVTVSGGEVVPFDSAAAMYNISVFKPGKTVIKVFVETAGVKSLLYSKTVQNKILPLTAEQKQVAQLKIIPKINLAGFYKGMLPFDSVKKITRFEINSPYKILGLVVYFSGSNSSDVQTHTLRSGEFDEPMQQLWKRIGVGSIVTLDNIKISDKTGKEYQIEGISFVVTEK